MLGKMKNSATSNWSSHNPPNFFLILANKTYKSFWKQGIDHWFSVPTGLNVEYCLSIVSLSVNISVTDRLADMTEDNHNLYLITSSLLWNFECDCFHSLLRTESRIHSARDGSLSDITLLIRMLWAETIVERSINEKTQTPCLNSPRHP